MVPHSHLWPSVESGKVCCMATARKQFTMALWRCMICFIFVSLTLKVLLSHINAAHGRRQDFWVYCGIDGCEQDFRVFNSFFRHIKRTHPLYLTNGSPPRGWRIPPTSHSLGSENVGVSVFANCSTATTTSTVEISTGGSLAEVQEPQVVDSPITVSVKLNKM